MTAMGRKKKVGIEQSLPESCLSTSTG